LASQLLYRQPDLPVLFCLIGHPGHIFSPTLPGTIPSEPGGIASRALDIWLAESGSSYVQYNKPAKRIGEFEKRDEYVVTTF
ncbi:MAG TPA: hypothetical protein VMC85_04210, partial [Desulfomonilaceae bacterium]|nr:hypothetical protein [Desulfomonilaceae bacterium]